MTNPGTDIILRTAAQLAAAGDAASLAQRALRAAPGASAAAGVGEGWRDARILQFGERSIGNLLAMHGDGEGISYTSFASAQGTVTVPAGTRVLLDLTVLDAAAWRTVAMLEAGLIQGLTARSDSPSNNQDEQLRHVAHLTDLQELCLVRLHVDPRRLRSLHRIIDLRLEGCTVEEGATAADLAHLDQLEELRLIDLPLDFIGFDPPASLRVLDLSHARIDANVLARIERCTELTHLTLKQLTTHEPEPIMYEQQPLDVFSVTLDDTTFAASLSASAPLREVDVSGTQVGDDTCIALARYLTLRELQLQNTAVGDVGIEHLAELPTVRLLWIHEANATGASLQAIGRMRTLENLSIGGIGATDEDVIGLLQLRQLRHFWASGNVFTDMLGVAFGVRLADLQGCDLSRTAIGSGVIEQLAQATRLTSLTVAGCQSITDLSTMLEQGELTELIADDCTSLDDAGVRGIECCRDLRTLRLSRTGITWRSMRRIAKLSRLRRFDVAGTDITDDSLGRVLAASRLLERLNVAHTRSSDVAIAQLLGNEHLGRVDLESTLVTSVGVQTLATCPALEWLDLSGTLIDDEALTHLALLGQPRDQAPGGEPAAAGQTHEPAVAPEPAGNEMAPATQAHDVAARLDAQLAELGIHLGKRERPSRLRHLDVDFTDLTGSTLEALLQHPHLTMVMLDWGVRGSADPDLIERLPVCSLVW